MKRLLERKNKRRNEEKISITMSIGHEAFTAVWWHVGISNCCVSDLTKETHPFHIRLLFRHDGRAKDKFIIRDPSSRNNDKCPYISPIAGINNLLAEKHVFRTRKVVSVYSLLVRATLRRTQRRKSLQSRPLERGPATQLLH